MDFNLVVLSGHLAAAPEVRTFESGSRLVRFLVTVQSRDPRRRVDVVPVTFWDPPDGTFVDLDRGCGIWVAGAVARRFWQSDAGRQSRLEIVARCVEPSNTSPSEAPV